MLSPWENRASEPFCAPSSRQGKLFCAPPTSKHYFLSTSLLKVEPALVICVYSSYYSKFLTWACLVEVYQLGNVVSQQPGTQQQLAARLGGRVPVKLDRKRGQRLKNSESTTTTFFLPSGLLMIFFFFLF